MPIDLNYKPQNCYYCKYAVCKFLGNNKGYSIRCTQLNKETSAKPSVIALMDEKKPKECPYSEENNLQGSYDKWKNVKPLTNYDSIKEYETYHLPPFLGFPRKNIFIIDKNTTFIKYTEEGETKINLAYKQDIVTKLLTKQRKLKMEEYEKTETTKIISPIVENLEPAIFLIFAEYLGYYTPCIKWCEDYCENGKIDSTKETIINTIAIDTLHKMKQDFSIEMIQYYYQYFYDLAIEPWADKLTKNQVFSD